MHAVELEARTRPAPVALRGVTQPPGSTPGAALLRLQATAGNRAVSRLLAEPGPARPGAPSAPGAPVAVQRRWETKYTIAGVSKQQQQAARGGRNFWQTVGMTAVGLRADVNAAQVGAGVSSGGRHAEDELITALHQLALAGHLLPNGSNTLTVRKLDASPCTSTPRAVRTTRRRKVVRKVKSKHGGIVKKRTYVPDRRRNAVMVIRRVVTSEKAGGVAGCTERLIDLKRNGVVAGAQVYGFQQITIEANNYYQGGPGRSLGGHRIAALERIGASVLAAGSINAEQGMSLTITPGAIGKGKGRRT